MKPIAGKKTQIGATLIEGLVAALIIGVAIMGLMSLWSFSTALSVKSDRDAIGYNIARRGLEKARALGFNAMPEGATIYYYDINGENESTVNSNHRYRLTITVTSDRMGSQGGVPQVASDALRTVVIAVVDLSNNATVETAGTTLVRGGV